MYTGLHVNYSYSSSDFNDTEFSREIFEESSNIKFHGDKSSGSRTVSMRTNVQRDRKTDLTKLMVIFRNSANAPKNCHSARYNNPEGKRLK